MGLSLSLSPFPVASSWNPIRHRRRLGSAPGSAARAGWGHSVLVAPFLVRGHCWHGLEWQGVAQQPRSAPCRRQMCRCSRSRPSLPPVFGK